MSLTILADENIPAVEHYLGALGRVILANGRTLERSQLRGIDVLLVRSVTRVDENLLSGSEVKFVGTATSGFDHIDRDYLARREIAFAHAPGANANSVVEYVLAAIAAVGEKLEHVLAGGVVGIVGYGHIGKALSARCAALGIRYRIYDPWLAPATIPHAADLAAVLACDVICLHPELTTAQPWPSHHLLGADELQSLRPEVLLINASRGPVVDNTELLAQLQRGCGPLTVLDVWEGEPEINAGLLERVTLGSAHIAGYSLDGKLLATRLLSNALSTHLHLPLPPGDSPLAEGPPLRLPQGLTAAALVRFLLHSHYDIRRDDALLRQTIADHQHPGSRAKAFDQLRKGYRDRRELAGTTVAGTALTPEQVAVLRALDCVCVAPGDGG